MPFTLKRQERRRIDIGELRFLSRLLGESLVTTPLQKPERPPSMPAPILTTTTPAPVHEYVPVTETARRIRDALGKAFPGQKFCVKSDSYSGGSSVTITWYDGPASKKVDAIVNQFEDVRRDQFGEISSGGNRYISAERRYTKSVYAQEKVEESLEPGGIMGSTIWQKLSTSDYPQVPFKCERGYAHSPEGTY